MPYKRFDELDEEKKTLILQTALDIFSENSFKLASINKISKEANLSAGALYYYFEDKKDLFNTTLNYMSREFMMDIGGLDTLFEEQGYWQGIKGLVRKRLALGSKQPKYMRLFHRILLSEDEQEMDAKETLLINFREIFNYGYDHGFLRQDMPKDFLFRMHFNMTLTVNQWTIQRNMNKDQDPLTMDELEVISMKAVDMIYSAMSTSDEIGDGK